MAKAAYSAATAAINAVSASLVVFIACHPITGDYRSQIDLDLDAARSPVASVARVVEAVAQRRPSPVRLFTGEQLVKRLEGYRTIAYPDAGTHGAPWTCGWGHTGSDCRKGTTVTYAQAQKWFKADYAKATLAVDNAVSTPLTYYQKSALVSFAFNAGEGNLDRSTMLKQVNAGQYADASRQFGKWIYAAGKPCGGLVFRRAVEALVFRM